MTDTVLSHFSSFLKCSFLPPEEVVKIPQLRFIQECIKFLTNLLELVCVNTSQKKVNKVFYNTDLALLSAEQTQNFACTTMCKKMPAGFSAETAAQPICGTKLTIYIPEKKQPFRTLLV